MVETKVNKGPGARRAPQRTCVGCGAVQPKREMVRVTRTPEGPIVVDPSGKRPGRGAYLCRKAQCWETGIGKKRLERSLKTTLTAEDIAGLRAFAHQLALVEAHG